MKPIQSGQMEGWATEDNESQRHIHSSRMNWQTTLLHSDPLHPAGVEKEDYTDLSTCQLSVRRHQGNWLKVLLKEKPSGLRCSNLDARVAHDWTVTLTVEQKRRLWRARARPLTCTHAHTHTHTVSVAFKKYAGFVTNKTEETETSCHTFLLEWIIGFINAYKFIVGTKTADIQIVLIFYDLSA